MQNRQYGLNAVGYTADERVTKEEKTGSDIVIKALNEPAIQLLMNAGLDNVQKLFKKIESSDSLIEYSRFYIC